MNPLTRPRVPSRCRPALPAAEPWPERPGLDGLLLDHLQSVALHAEPATTGDGAAVLVDARLVWQADPVASPASALRLQAMHHAVHDLARSTLAGSLGRFSLGQWLQQPERIQRDWFDALGQGLAALQARLLLAEVAGLALSPPQQAHQASCFVAALRRSAARVRQRTDTRRRRAHAAAMNTTSPLPVRRLAAGRPPAPPTVLDWRYDRVASSLHWGLAALLTFMAALGWTMGALEHDPGSAWLRGLHQTLGLLALLLLAVRVAWRLKHVPARLPPGVPGWQQRLAAVAHGLLYLLMGLVPLAGLLGASYSTAGLVALGGAVPRWLVPDPVRAEWLLGVHEVLVWALVALVLVHVAGALRHLMVDRDGVFQRMGWQPR